MVSSFGVKRPTNDLLIYMEHLCSFGVISKSPIKLKKQNNFSLELIGLPGQVCNHATLLCEVGMANAFSAAKRLKTLNSAAHFNQNLEADSGYKPDQNHL